MRYIAIAFLSCLALACAKKDDGKGMMGAKKGKTSSPSRATSNRNDNTSSNNNNANGASAIAKQNSICFPYQAQDRPTFGVCFAYCDVQQCHTQTTLSPSCITLQSQFAHKTGLSQLPCNVPKVVAAPPSMGPTLAPTIEEVPTATNSVAAANNGVPSVIAISVAWMDNMPTLGHSTMAPSPVDA